MDRPCIEMFDAKIGVDIIAIIIIIVKNSPVLLTGRVKSNY